MSLQNYGTALKRIPSIHDALNYYLLNNLIIETQIKKAAVNNFTMRVSISYDSLLFFVKSRFTCKRSQTELKCLQPFFEIYEFFCGLQTHSSYSLVYLEMILIESIEFFSGNSNISTETNSNMKSLEEFFNERKFYRSYSLVSNYIGNRQQEATFQNSINKCSDFYGDLTKFIGGIIKLSFFIFQT